MAETPAETNANSPWRRLVRGLRPLRFVLGGILLAGIILLWAVLQSGGTPGSPGRLTAAHSGLDGRCADCHSAAGKGLAAWLQKASSRQRSQEDSARCLACHRLGPHAGNPHDLGPAELTAVRRRIGVETSDSRIEQRHCASCHREHRGRAFDPTRHAEARCHTCHAVTFDSFSADHPAFEHYPYERRPRIRFDHSTHYRVHFANFERLMPEGRAPERCTDCHRIGPAGNMPVRSYETACASCHSGQIEETILPALTIMAVPALNVEALAEGNVAVGGWPRLAEESSSGELPPFMRLLRTRLTDGSVTYERLRRFDPDEAGPEQLEAVETYAWSVKTLLHALTRPGAAASPRQSGDPEGQRDSDNPGTEFEDVVGDPAFRRAVRSAQRRWLPGLVAEIRDYRNGRRPETRPVETSVAQGLGGPETGWLIRENDGTVRYRATGHADPVLGHWLDLLGRLHGSDDKTTRQTASRALAVLADPTTTGRCLKCHTVDRAADGRLRVNWTGRRSRPFVQRFTRFNHAPHVTVAAAENCRECHELDEEIRLHRVEFVRRDWTVNTNPAAPVSSGFGPISKDRCAACHTEEQAGKHCLDCHNYHIGRVGPAGFSARGTADSH